MSLKGRNCGENPESGTASVAGSLSDSAAQSLFIRLFEAAGDAIVMFDARERIQDVNPAIERILGYTPDEVRGRPITFLLADEMQAYVEQLFATYAQRDEHSFVGQGPSEISARHKNGETRYLEAVVEEVRLEDQVLFFAIARDVTERRRREADLRKSEMLLNDAQRMASIGNWELDLKADRLVWTDQIFEMFEVDKDRFGASYEAFLEAIHPDDRETVDTAYKQSLEDRTPYVVVHRLLMEDGRVKWVEERCSTDFDDEGTPLVSRGTVQDITERKTAEMAIEAARDEALAASRTKSEFLANMSHELRTPLNAILGFAEIIDKETFGPLGAPQYREYIRDIRESGRHLLDVLSDIIDVSRVETGHTDFSPDAVDIHLLTDTCRAIVTGRLEAKNQTYAATIEDGIETIYADARLVKQMVLNLLSNAVKFTPEGGRIEVAVRKTGGGETALSVTDTGIGIKREDMARITEPFVQAEGSLARRHEGAGLGLALTKSLAELHGGRLAISSQPGEGTTVTVFFPPASQARQRA